jgi:hypothetical protein
MPDPSPPSGADIIRIEAWTDPVIDAIGCDPRSLYVEQFWLGVIGPTATWLLRHLAFGLDAEPSGFDLDAGHAAKALGIGGRSGRHSPLQRSISRCVSFDLARRHGDTTVLVRRRVPPLPRRLLVRLPGPVQQRHRQWSDERLRSGRPPGPTSGAIPRQPHRVTTAETLVARM